MNDKKVTRKYLAGIICARHRSGHQILGVIIMPKADYCLILSNLHSVNNDL